MSRFVGINKTLWHMRLGHPHDQVLRYVCPNDRSIINKCTNLVQTCTHCLYGKMHNLPFPKSQFVASSPFELVHSDVWGPAPITSINGFRYYVIFVDHFTRFTWLYLLKSKFEVFSKFILFKALVETQFSTKIKTLRFDGGGEYTSTALSHICPNMALSIRFLAHIHPKKMDLLKGNIGTLLKPQSPFYLKLLCPLPFGPMLFLLHFF